MPLFSPGMDPYLENLAIFPGIHGPMIAYLRDQIAPRMRPRYVASVGDRVYVEYAAGSDHAIIPDIWIRHARHKNGIAGSLVAEL